MVVRQVARSSVRNLRAFFEKYLSRLWRFRFDEFVDGVACPVVGDQVDDGKCMEDLEKNMEDWKLYVFLAMKA